MATVRPAPTNEGAAATPHAHARADEADDACGCGHDHDHHHGHHHGHHHHGAAPGMTMVRQGPKVGRNDPCLCGSGKKYKKCCLGQG
ncbi:MAG: SEC-C metal-binding domain-containing protein [Hyphomicrobiaceae bacterium]